MSRPEWLIEGDLSFLTGRLSCRCDMKSVSTMSKIHWGIPAYNGPLTCRIRKLVPGNPKRGAARLRFNQYRDDMTVAAYISACDSLDVPNYALFDITRDRDPRRQLIV